jgi:hypothetical protein
LKVAPTVNPSTVATHGISGHRVESVCTNSSEEAKGEDPLPGSDTALEVTLAELPCVVPEDWMDRTLCLLNFVNYMSILLLIHNLARKTLVGRLIVVSF